MELYLLRTFFQVPISEFEMHVIKSRYEGFYSRSSEGHITCFYCSFNRRFAVGRSSAVSKTRLGPIA